MILAGLATVFLLTALLNVLFWPAVARRGSRPNPAVSILIPARDEEANLPDCLSAAGDAGALETLVYDDHSKDGTAALVREWSRADPRIRLIPPRELPAGWAGKTFACHTLASEARGEWLLFIDADSRLGSGAAESIVAEALARSVTFLSCWPAIEMRSFAERLLMPMLNFVVFTLFPAPLSLGRQSPSLGLAHGACILAHRATYLRLGGHALVRSQLFEDTRLAQAWRAAGERSLCLDGASVIRVRMYRDLPGIWNGFRKNFYPAFRHVISFFAFLLLHFTVFLMPFFLRSWTAAAVVLATRLALALRFRHPLWSVLLHPLAEAVLIALGLASFWSCVFGKGVEWKGRVYRPA